MLDGDEVASFVSKGVIRAFIIVAILAAALGGGIVYGLLR